MPKLLVDLRFRDLALLIVLIVAAFAARLGVLFLLLPILSLTRLTQPISNAYKLAIAWGGLRGALTLVLALSVTENPALPQDSTDCCASRSMRARRIWVPIRAITSSWRTGLVT